MRFYCDGLGCEPAERYQLDLRSCPVWDTPSEVGDRAVIVSRMITQGSLRIELIEWKSPGAEVSAAMRSCP